MQVAGYEFRLYLEKLRHEVDGLLQRLHGAQVTHIADIGRGIEQIVMAEAEGVLQLAADAEHLAVPIPGEHDRQRCEAAAAAYHIGGAAIPVGHRVIGPQAYAAVM